MYIYIHIPFCSHICSYCDFPKMLYDHKFCLKYLDALEREIKERYLGEEVVSLYIGGGTPTSLSEKEFERLLQITRLFKKSSSVEFTVESNVEGLSNEKIRLIKKYGVNRVSLGVQSFHDDTLKILGRNHDVKMVREVVSSLKKAGIFNISIDYIYGVSDCLKEVEEDIETFLALDVPHFSAYSLIIEENTLFSIQKRKYIDEEKEYQMYQMIEKILIKNHYQHYEISNYGKKGYFSLHNLNYWNNGCYYGFGLGAVSYLNHVRISNTLNLGEYIKGNYRKEEIEEDIKVRISNEFILGLRKIEGIDATIFFQKYHLNILHIPCVLDLIEEKKLIYQNHHLFISPKYLYLSNEILINFI